MSLSVEFPNIFIMVELNPAKVIIREKVVFMVNLNFFKFLCIVILFKLRANKDFFFGANLNSVSRAKLSSHIRYCNSIFFLKYLNTDFKLGDIFIGDYFLVDVVNRVSGSIKSGWFSLKVEFFLSIFNVICIIRFFVLRAFIKKCLRQFLLFLLDVSLNVRKIRINFYHFKRDKVI